MFLVQACWPTGDVALFQEKASQGGKLPAAHLATNLGVDCALVQGVGTNQLLELPAC